MALQRVKHMLIDFEWHRLQLIHAINVLLHAAVAKCGSKVLFGFFVTRRLTFHETNRGPRTLVMVATITPTVPRLRRRGARIEDRISPDQFLAQFGG
jgi:hypothetical protein